MSSAEKLDKLSGSVDNPLRQVAAAADDNDNDNGLASRKRGNIRHGRRDGRDGLGKRPLAAGAERSFFRDS